MLTKVNVLSSSSCSGTIFPALFSTHTYIHTYDTTQHRQIKIPLVNRCTARIEVKLRAHKAKKRKEKMFLTVYKEEAG